MKNDRKIEFLIIGEDVKNHDGSNVKQKKLDDFNNL